MLKKRFVKVWLLILVLVGVILSARFLVFNQQAPSIQDVLSHNQLGGAFDLSMIVASLLALSLATLSAAKGYEVYKRHRATDEISLSDILDSAETEEKPNDDFLEMKRSAEMLKQANEKLLSRLKGLHSETEDFKRTEGMLRKSNIALSRECERLKSENEEIVLKVKAVTSQPKAKTKAKTKKIKTKRSIRARKRRSAK